MLNQIKGIIGTSMILCFTSEKVCDDWRSEARGHPKNITLHLKIQ
jgi:hypothetical protein